jgi:hypothetical protein
LKTVCFYFWLLSFLTEKKSAEKQEQIWPKSPLTALASIWSINISKIHEQLDREFRARLWGVVPTHRTIRCLLLYDESHPCVCAGSQWPGSLPSRDNDSSSPAGRPFYLHLQIKPLFTVQQAACFTWLVIVPCKRRQSLCATSSNKISRIWVTIIQNNNIAYLNIKVDCVY